MVSAAGAQKCRRLSDPLRDFEAQHSAIETYRALQIGDDQGHMANLDAAIDRLGHTSMIAHFRGRKSSAPVQKDVTILAGTFGQGDMWLKYLSSSRNRWWPKTEPSISRARAAGKPPMACGRDGSSSSRRPAKT